MTISGIKLQQILMPTGFAYLMCLWPVHNQHSAYACPPPYVLWFTTYICKYWFIYLFNSLHHHLSHYCQFHTIFGYSWLLLNALSLYTYVACFSVLELGGQAFHYSIAVFVTNKTLIYCLIDAFNYHCETKKFFSTLNQRTPENIFINVSGTFFSHVIISLVWFTPGQKK